MEEDKKNSMGPEYEWDEWWSFLFHNIFSKNQNHLYRAAYFLTDFCHAVRVDVKGEVAWLVTCKMSCCLHQYEGINNHRGNQSKKVKETRGQMKSADHR